VSGGVNSFFGSRPKKRTKKNALESGKGRAFDVDLRCTQLPAVRRSLDLYFCVHADTGNKEISQID